MSHIFIDEYPILTFEFEPFIDKYWNIGLSQYIIEQYGNSTTYDHEKVEKILMSCFEYFISQFKDLILKQDTEIFFKSVFLFHEASIALYIKQLEGFQLPEVIESDFPRYRRVLKLILEQACDIELTAKKGLDYKEIINTIIESKRCCPSTTSLNPSLCLKTNTGGNFIPNNKLSIIADAFFLSITSSR